MTANVKRNGIKLLVIFLVIIVCCLVILLIRDRWETKQVLFQAIEENNQSKAVECLDKYPSLVNETQQIFWLVDVAGDTPLTAACQAKDFEMIKILVECGANVNKPTAAVGAYPLHIALEQKEFDIAWYLIENGANLSKKSGSWEESVLVCILSRRVDLNDTEFEQAQFELFKYAIENGASLDPPRGSTEGIKSLFGLAAYKNNAMIVQYLLDNQLCGINDIVNPKNTKKTALILAVQQNSYTSCQVLLRYGADKSIKDIDGKSALDYALELQDEKLVDMLSQ